MHCKDHVSTPRVFPLHTVDLCSNSLLAGTLQNFVLVAGIYIESAVTKETQGSLFHKHVNGIKIII
jgi:hypothetical protein